MKRDNHELCTYSAFLAKAEREPNTALCKSILSKGLEFVGSRDFLRHDSVVFVKPNLTFPCYRRGVTTNPSLLRSVLEILKERCERVIVGESDGGNRAFRAEQAFAGHNLYEMAAEIGVELISLSRLSSVFIEHKIQQRTVRVQLPKLLLDEVDCLVSVPVLKVHAMTGVSLGIKNLWGCYPDAMRVLHHDNLDYKLALLAKLLNPRITIIDGTYGLTEHGPMFGQPLQMNLILVSNNVVVADALGTSIMGIPIKTANHIKVAEKEGLGTTCLEKVNMNTDWKQYKKQFCVRKTLVDRANRVLFNSYTAAKLVYDSPFTPLVYYLVDRLRSAEETDVAVELKTTKY